MKKQDLVSLKNKTIDELQKSLGEAKEQSQKIRVEVSLGKSKNVHTLNKKKKEIAKLKTVIREKQILEKKKGSK